MIPLLAPLLGSLAGSLLPATLGTGVASALGLSGAAGGLVAAAAPKAIGAGIGTLLAGGDLGEAAINAVGFGAAGAALPKMAGAAAAGSSAAPAAAAPAALAAPATVPTGASAAAGNATQGIMSNLQNAGRVMSALGGGQKATPMPAPQPQPVAQGGTRASENPMLASMPAAPSMLSQMSPATVPSVGGSSMMPASVGIGSIPMQGQGPMNNDMLLAGMSPNQRNMASQYLRDQGMVGFV